MSKHHQSGFMKRLGRMFANLGGLYGRLYGPGNAGSVTTQGFAQSPPAKRRTRKRHGRKQRGRSR
jgi:hypothetical protein